MGSAWYVMFLKLDAATDHKNNLCTKYGDNIYCSSLIPSSVIRLCIPNIILIMTNNRKLRWVAICRVWCMTVIKIKSLHAQKTKNLMLIILTITSSPVVIRLFCAKMHSHEIAATSCPLFPWIVKKSDVMQMNNHEYSDLIPLHWLEKPGVLL